MSTDLVAGPSSMPLAAPGHPFPEFPMRHPYLAIVYGYACVYQSNECWVHLPVTAYPGENQYGATKTLALPESF